MKVQGHLTKINQKSGQSARGKWTLYSLGIDDKGDGEVTWYSFGFDAPKVSEGSFVSFDVEEDAKGRKNVVKGSLVLEKKTSAVAKKYASGNDQKQDSIVRQNATSTSANILNGMIQFEIIKLPAQSKRYDFYLEMLDELTNRLFLANREPLSVEQVAELVGLPAGEDSPSDEGGPEDADWEPV